MDDISLVQKPLLVANRQIADGIFAMDLAAPALAADASPGQFVMVSVSEDLGLFLRRPFSLAGIDREAGTIRLIYQFTGKGTAYMAQWEAGRHVDVLGPLGTGFTWDEAAKHCLLAGGGMGIAPLLPLAKALRAQGKHITAFLGTRSLRYVFGLKLLEEWGCEVQLATEDGSRGFTGFATTPLEAFLDRPRQDSFSSGSLHHHDEPYTLFACGPRPFLKAIAALCCRYDLEGQLSMEERMGCGFGACMGCSAPMHTSDGSIKNRRICCEGPVFNLRDPVF